MIRRLLLSFIIVIGIILILGLLYSFFFTSALSSDQEETRKLLDNPDQFVITYLPRGGDDDTVMVRSEVWYYHDIGKQISFLAGEVVSVDPYISEGKSSSTELLPEEFDVVMDLSEVQRILDTEAIVQVSDVPVFDSQNIKTYISDSALFIIEDGYLTYFQTLTEDASEMPLDINEATPQITQKTPSDNRMQNSVYGFSIVLPSGWFLGEDDVVLTNYEVSEETFDSNLPEHIVKCDFIQEPPASSSELSEINTFTGEKGISITQYSILSEEAEGPGYGDGIAYQLSEYDKKLWLICYFLDDSLIDSLENTLKSIQYEK